MTQYITIPQEKSLLLSPYNIEQLKLLSKSSASPIQIVSFKGVKTLKSMDDSYRKIRIVILALLIKFYVTYNEENEVRLNRLKKMIYRAKLQAITEQKGIVRQQLLKSVACQLNHLKIGNEAELQIIKMFNCSPFFDQTLICAMKQQNPLIISSDCELSIWLSREFSLKVLWNQEALIEETNDQLCLIGLGEEFHASKHCKSQECFFKGYTQYLRFSTQILTDDEQNSLKQIQNRVTRDHLFSCPMSPEDNRMSSQYLKPPFNSNLYMSIQSISPGYKDNLQQSKENRGKLFNSPEGVNVGLFDSVNSSSFSRSRKLIEQQQKQKTIKVRRSSKNESSSLWNLFCCSLGP